MGGRGKGREIGREGDRRWQEGGWPMEERQRGREKGEEISSNRTPTCGGMEWKICVVAREGDGVEVGGGGAWEDMIR